MKKNVSCLNSRAIIEYTRRNFPGFMEDLLSDLDPFFENIENLELYMLDEHNWISQRVLSEMFRRIRVFSGKEEVAREIGHQAVTNRRYGYIENIFIKAIGHPHLGILRAPTINAKFSKTKTVEIVESDWSHAVLRLKWYEGIDSTRDTCLYNQGIYEAIPTIWGLPLAVTTELKCYFDGDEYCEFHFVWAKKSIITLIVSLFSKRKKLFNETLAELEREKMLIEQKYEEVETLNIDLKEKIDRLTSLDACSKATASILDTDQLLDTVMSLIVNIMKFDRAIIMMIDESGDNLMPMKSVGETDGSFKELVGYKISLKRTSNILARVATSGIAQTIKDVDNSYLRKENMILKKFSPKSFIVVPLISRNKVIGIMAAERVKGLEDFTPNDLDYVMNFCNQIAISLQNAHLVANMKQSFVSSILSLASALEAKDSYTRGHSNRVATYSTIIARRMGVDRERIEMLRLMALMHDIGKIGIPDNIINKAGKLDDEEFLAIKRHTNVSVSIIEPLLANKPELVDIRSHHERFDGHGYPEGLSGNQIPLEARIMGVADSFDAMTTCRPYREPMSKHKAMDEIKTHKGTQFCPEVVEIFVDILTSMPDDLYTLINNGYGQAPTV